MDVIELFQFWIIPSFYAITVILGIPLNALALWVLIRKKKSSMCVYMLNLAAGDLLFLLFLPIKIDYHFRQKTWTLPGLTCIFHIMLFFINFYANLILLAVISVDRYVAIVHPLRISRLRQPKVAWLLCLLCWVFSLINILPVTQVKHFLSYDNVTANNGSLLIVQCYEKFTAEDAAFVMAYRLYLFFAIYLASLVTALFCYGNVVRVLVMQRGQTELLSRKKKIHAAKITAVSLITYIVCFIPYNSTHITGFIQSKINAFSPKSLLTFRDVALCLSVSNSLFDPLIIYVASSSFRNSIKKMLKCREPVSRVAAMTD
ncbi:lysophosphatidic acid receptor 5-like [Lethenteron reissneri]|uniref:lysophosphatidic acid receptor 5-like n=1 Tax=Lethenteron reissneri TaxID=7753 RepID=UPI002AB78D43|nr:lysophosphatidic acid receptor 5-like [Lethenteron reissneri]